VLTLPPTVRVFVASAPVDLRKGFDGLSALVQSSFGHDPLSGFLFVFYNRRGEQVRILFFDRTGYCTFLPTSKARARRCPRPNSR